MSPAILGAVRGLGIALLFALVSWLANAANLHGLVNDTVATVVAAVALAIEHKMEADGSGALFGSARCV